MKRSKIRVNSAVSEIRERAATLAQTQPATSDLLHLAADRVEKFDGCVQIAQTESMTAGRAREMKRWGTDFYQIATWIGGTPPPTSAAELVSSLIENVQMGWLPELALHYLDIQRKARSGKPPTASRTEGLAVMNLLRLQPKTTWIEVARACCRCGKTRHDRACEQRLRAQLRELKSFIARLRR